MTDAYDSYDGNNDRTEDFYGYRWTSPVEVARLVFTAGKVYPNGGWFETLQVQVLDDQKKWVPAEQVRIAPDIATPEYRRNGETRFGITFKPVTTTGIRIVGKPGGSARFTSVAELEVYAK